MTRYGRATRVEGSVVQARLPQPHPDAERATKRMPYEQLRSLVVSLIDAELVDVDELVDQTNPAGDDDPDAAVREFEFETQRTTCLPGPRTSTLDQLIAALPRYERFPRGSSAHLPQDRLPTERVPAYITRPETVPDRRRAVPPPRPRDRDRSRSGGGRGSQRR